MQMTDNIKQSNLLNKEQFGFQSKKSSTDALMVFPETIIEKKENGRYCTNFKDHVKKFISVLQKIVFKAADCPHFSATAGNVLQSFLKEQLQ